jgi:glycosyltransferase involved in cell wall biosynthesis
MLAEALSADIIDVENYREFGGLPVRIAARMGRQWGVAAAAVQHAHKYDAIIALSDDVGVPMAALMQLAGTATPGMMICQHMASRRPEVLIGTLRMTRALRWLLCMCPEQANVLRDQFHVPAEKLRVIHWQTDHRFYRPMPEIPVRRQVCSAGMTGRDYGTLVRATKDLGVHVKIEARSAWLDGGANTGGEAPHSDVEFCNYGTSAGLRELYAESAIVTVPLEDVRYVAGYSTLLEGMAMGKPVIASRIRLIGEFIKDGWNGLLVRQGDPADLREKIAFLLDHPDEARRMGENARRTVEEQFTMDHYRERMRAAVIDAVQHVGAPAPHSA